jgi:Putative peptidoglycan binding domain
MVAGKNLFVTLGDLAAAMGQPIKAFAKNSKGLYEVGAWVDDLIPTIRKVATVTEVRGLSSLQQVQALAKQGTGVVIFAIKATVKSGGAAKKELWHSVIAVRTLTGQVQYADYGGKLVGSLRELVTSLNYGTPVAIELLQSRISAAVVSAKYTGEIAMKLSQGAVLAIEGLTAIETSKNGVEFARPVEVGAVHVPTVLGPVPNEVLRASLAAYTARKSGKPVIRLPETVVRPASAIAPSADRVDGIQFRLNALGYCAGWEDNIMGPRTQRAIRHFQRDYPPLVPDGNPGALTRTKLVHVCRF